VQTTRARKTLIIDVSFDTTDFPPLEATKSKETSTIMTTATTQSTNAASANTAMTTPPYDYKTELKRLLKEIKTNLHPQFKCLFTQLDQKIDALIQACKDQEKVNINVSKQTRLPCGECDKTP